MHTLTRLAATATLLALLAGCAPSVAFTPAPSSTPVRSAATGPAGRVLAIGLDVPWDLAALRGGAMLITLRDKADVVRLEPDGRLVRIAHIADAVPAGEGGLLGIALSPGFSGDSAVYLYYTAAGDNRVVRFRYTGSALADAHPILTGIPKGTIHNGGRLRFGPDGDLYIGTGETGNPRLAQDTGSLGGKILRVRPDGSIPADNPFGNPVYSYGHRNVQGLGWDGGGRLYASEFGANSFDELNVIVRGGNYGWPVVEGAGARAGMREPLVTWPTSEASPSGIAVTPEGVVYVAALRGERVWRTQRQGDRMTAPEVFARGFGRIRAVEIVGSELYLLTDNTFRGDPAADDDRLVALPLS